VFLYLNNMPSDNKQSSINNNQATTTDDAPPVLVMDDSLPPTPQENVPSPLAPTLTPPIDETKKEDVEVKTETTNSGSAAPSDDINLPPVVMGTTPKKKFAGGRVIATILGLLLLVGGLGAGTYLVKQNQDIREKAAIRECFPAGTKISTIDGLKNIEEFGIGDKVLSEGENGEREVSSTQKLWKLWSFNMCSVDFESGEKLKLTNPHPLYTQDGWKAINVKSAKEHNPSLSISQLTEDDSVKKLDGSWDNITSISCEYGLFRVYNLAVDNNNNYFAEGFLAHNKGGVDFIPDPTHDYILDDNQDILYEYDENDNLVQDNSNDPSNTSSINYNTDKNNCGGTGQACVQGCNQGSCSEAGSSCNDPSDCGYGLVCKGSEPATATCQSTSTVIIPAGVTRCNAETPGVPESIGVCCSTGGTSYNYEGGGSFVGDHWTTCLNGYTCQQDYGCVPSGGTNTTTNGNNPTPTPPTITAQCQNVKAYNSSWTLLTNTQLAQLEVGDSVNFCVAGVATGGSFDKAKFTINTVVQAETTTIRPSSTDFCQTYVIPAGVTSFNVSAQIHHVSLGWK